MSTKHLSLKLNNLQIKKVLNSFAYIKKNTEIIPFMAISIKHSFYYIKYKY